MTYNERLAWIDGGWERTEAPSGLPFVPSLHAAGGAGLYRLRRDPPLPPDSALGAIAALPDTMAFTDGSFTYNVAFSEQLLSEDGQSLIHPAGADTCAVDLAAKIVSLTAA